MLNQCVNFEEEIDPETKKPKVKSYEGSNIDMDYQFLEDELAPWKKRSRASYGKFTIPSHIHYGSFLMFLIRNIENTHSKLSDLLVYNCFFFKFYS